MIKGVSTRTAFEGARKTFVTKEGPATAFAEQKARATGKLNPLVDPAGYGVIRRSLPRFIKRKDGLWEMAVGMPRAIESELDTTASMGNNVDIALAALADMFEMCVSVLPGRDPQILIGIFGDVVDPFVLCRPQYEMDAEKITEQLTLMVPVRDGGDFAEDPHYGIFGGAYLTETYSNWLGLLDYYFTTSDAPARDRLDVRQLVRIYGEEVFDKVAENGHQIDRNHLPDTKEVVQDLLRRAHSFFLQVGSNSETTRFWTRLYGPERVVILPETKYLPHVQAVIIGLTEGTLDLQTVDEFLKRHNVDDYDAKRIVRAVANIPIGAQAALPNFHKQPKKGDLFRNKTDLHPIDSSELDLVSSASDENKPDEGADWL